jgi:hypothetical protein
MPRQLTLDALELALTDARRDAELIDDGIITYVLDMAIVEVRAKRSQIDGRTQLDSEPLNVVRLK